MQVGGSDVVVDGASCDGRTELVKAIQGQNAGVSAVLLCRSLLLKKCRMCHSRPTVCCFVVLRGHPRRGRRVRRKPQPPRLYSPRTAGGRAQD